MKAVKQLVMIITLGLFSIFGCKQEGSSISTIDAPAFKMSMENDNNFLLLDVRTPEEFAEGKLANSVNIDFYADDFKQQISKLDKDKTCYVYCRSGKRSHKTAVMMYEMKFAKVVDLKDGINGWKEKGYAVE